MKNVPILVTINEYGAYKNIENTDLNIEKIKTFKVFNSNYLYQFNLSAGNNSLVKLELIFDTKNNKYNNFSLSHIFEYQNDNSNFKILYLPVTETTQGDKTILTFSHQITDKSTTKVVFELIPNYDANNVNILGFEDIYKNENEYETILSFNNSIELISMYTSIKYKFMYPIQANQTNHFQLNISKIFSYDNFYQSVNICECWSNNFNECDINETLNFEMNKINDSTILSVSHYQKKNDSIKNIVFEFYPLYNFYDVVIKGFKENDPDSTPDSTPDSDSGSSSDSAPDSPPDSGSSSFAVLISIIISIIIISVIVFFIYLYIKKRRSKDINFDQRDSLGDDFLLNE